jgi:hypothetical protein
MEPKDLTFSAVQMILLGPATTTATATATTTSEKRKEKEAILISRQHQRESQLYRTSNNLMSLCHLIRPSQRMKSPN